MAYRDGPLPDLTMQPRIWRRPWMTRVTTVVVCLASPLFIWQSWVFICAAPVPIQNSGLVIAWFVVNHVLGCCWLAIGGICSDTMTQVKAMQLAWGWVAGPYLLVRRCLRWIIKGH